MILLPFFTMPSYVGSHPSKSGPGGGSGEGRSPGRFG